MKQSHYAIRAFVLMMAVMMAGVFAIELGIMALLGRRLSELPPLNAGLIDSFLLSIVFFPFLFFFFLRPLQYTAYHDVLTGLPNEARLSGLLGEEIEIAAKRGQILVMVFADINNFKEINDTFGRDFGDMVLKEVGLHLSANDHVKMVARFGNDEFGAVLQDVSCKDDVIEVLDGIIEDQKTPLHIEGREIEISLKIGAVIYPDQAASAGELISKAEAAARMFEADKMPYLIYSQRMDDDLRDRQELAYDLEGAVGRHEFELYYQPIVDISTKRITSCEALIRWQHPKLGLLSPDAFVPIAENTGQILQIGEWVLNEACSQLKSWMSTRPIDIESVAISINLSARQLYMPDMVDKVVDALERSGLSPKFIELEITETMLMKNIEKVQGTLRELDDLGVRLAIDDFGTGYSSLAYVREFPVSVCKIDRSFVGQINVDPNKRMVMETIIELAQKMGMTVTAEGVEDEDQLAALTSLNCDNAQGYLFSKPIPSEDFLALLLRESQGEAA